MTNSIISMGLCSLLLATADVSCTPRGTTTATSDSGVQKTSVKVKTDIDGLTIEQKNVRDRVLEDNKPGSIKHLYVLSPYSGQTIIYSTVRGKVTSGGKRLTPKTVTPQSTGDSLDYVGMSVGINGNDHWTSEVLQDDGTYGDSGDYLFWFDSKGIYHQHYLTGGQIVHVSSEPLAVKSVIINMEETK